MSTIVYVARALPVDLSALLGDGYEVRGGGGSPERRAVQVAQARDAQVYVPTYLDPVDADLLSQLPALRHVASYGVGLDHIDLAACRERGLVVTNTPGVLTEAVADLTFGLLLDAARRVSEGDRFVRAGRWADQDPGRLLGTEVFGKTLGIVGLGRIGRAVAKRALGFSMKILYASPRDAGSAFIGSHVDLDTLLRESDFVSIHAPLTPATRGLVTRERLLAMKKGAVLVNTSRGAIVDEEALMAVLEEGHLGAAGLDVFAQEPKVPEKLRRMENVVLTPHIGSGSLEARQAMVRLVAEDIAAVAAGRPAANAVP